MQLTAHLILEHNDDPTGNGPHVTMVGEVPWDQADEHETLRETKAAMSQADQETCAKEGVLRFTLDYGYEVDVHGSECSRVMRDVRTRVEKLTDERKSAIRSWLQDQYGVSPADEDFQTVLDQPEIKDRITADMTIANMSRKAFKEALKIYQEIKHDLAKGAELQLPYPLKMEDMNKIVTSMTRHKIAESMERYDADTFYDNVALKMRTAWPFSDGMNYPKDLPVGSDHAMCLFPIGGFYSRAEVIVKSGQYWCRPPFVDESDGFVGYDKGGIARNAEGEMIPADALHCLDGYRYLPHVIFSRQFADQEARDVIDRWVNAIEKPPLYDGIENNCVSVAGKVAFGKYYKALEHLAGIENLENGVSHKVTYSMLTRGVYGKYPYLDGFSVTVVEPPNPIFKSNPKDELGIKHALEQVKIENGYHIHL